MAIWYPGFMISLIILIPAQYLNILLYCSYRVMNNPNIADLDEKEV